MSKTKHTLSHTRHLLLAAAAAAFILVPATRLAPVMAEPSKAAASSVDTYVGRYRHNGGSTDLQARDRAINNVVGKMSFIARPIARKKLKEVTAITQSVAIARNGGDLIIYVGDERRSAPLGGSAIEVVAKSGEKMKLTHRYHRGRLIQTFDGGKQGRRNIYELDARGRLAMHVTIWAKQLPEDLSYTLRYARQQTSKR